MEGYPDFTIIILMTSRPGELWDQLEDIDNTNALTFVWNGSNHNKQLLDALGMYTQNIVSPP